MIGVLNDVKVIKYFPKSIAINHKKISGTLYAIFLVFNKYLIYQKR